MITIDPELQSLIPPLSEDEFRQLEENCVKEGIRDALIVWPQQDGRNVLVDGHNRWKIAADHGGLPFQIKQMDFRDREEAKAWIIRNQFGRRNLSVYDRSVLALKLKPVIQAEAKKRMVDAPQKNREQQKEIAEIEKAGYSYDVSRNLIEAVKRKYAKEQRADLMANEKRIYFARYGETGLKVGSSIDPESRVRQLSVSCPGITLVDSVHYGDGAEAFENTFKKRFSKYLTAGECYQCSDDVLQEMIAYTKRAAQREDETERKLAKIAGVSNFTIHKVEVVENNAPEEIKEKARSGQISVNEAYRQTTNIMRPLKKTDIAKQAAEQHKEFEEKKNSNVVSMKDMTADKENRRILALEFSKRLTKASSAINDIVILQGDLKKIVSELTEEEKADSKAIIKNTMKVLTELYEKIGG